MKSESNFSVSISRLNELCIFLLELLVMNDPVLLLMEIPFLTDASYLNDPAGNYPCAVFARPPFAVVNNIAGNKVRSTDDEIAAGSNNNDDTGPPFCWLFCLAGFWFSC